MSLKSHQMHPWNNMCQFLGRKLKLTLWYIRWQSRAGLKPIQHNKWHSSSMVPFDRTEQMSHAIVHEGNHQPSLPVRQCECCSAHVLLENTFGIWKIPTDVVWNKWKLPPLQKKIILCFEARVHQQASRSRCPVPLSNTELQTSWPVHGMLAAQDSSAVGVKCLSGTFHLLQ